MADKRKAGTGKAKRTVTSGRRTAAGTAGRIAVRRDTAPYRSAAMEEHTTQVREQIEAALAEARRMREDIEQRIDERLKEDDGNSVDKILTQLTATARLRALHPPDADTQGKGGQSKRSRSSK
jgi:ribosomal protein L7/L12